MVRGVSAVPVIVATARDDEREVVRVLDVGADDYVVKPYSADQIDARIRAVLRRSPILDDGDLAGLRPGQSTLVIGELVVDRSARVASLAGAPLTLSRKEFDLLHYLAVHQGAVVTKQELLTAVWRQPYLGSERTVDTHLSWLRAKLGETASDPHYLHTVRGVGIKLVDPGN